MKTSIGLIAILALASSNVVRVEATIFGFLRRNNGNVEDEADNTAAIFEDEADNADATIDDFSNYTNVDFDNDEGGEGVSILGGGFLTREELDIGRTGFQCLQYAAGVENDPFGDILGVMSRPMTRVMLEFYGEEGINMLCASTHKGRELLGKEQLETVDNENLRHDPYSHASLLTERKTQTCTKYTMKSPDDPDMDPQGIYAEYSAKYLDQFLSNNQRNQRSDSAAVLSGVRTQLDDLREVRTNLNRCNTIWNGVNYVTGLIDVPFVDQDKISESIQSFSCGLTSTYNDIVISRKERDLERLLFHDQVIDGLEMQATYRNALSLTESFCAVESALDESVVDVKDIKVRAYEL